MKPPSRSQLLRASITLGTLALVFKVLALIIPSQAIAFDTVGNGVLFGYAAMLLIALIAYIKAR